MPAYLMRTMYVCRSLIVDDDSVGRGSHLAIDAKKGTTDTTAAKSSPDSPNGFIHDHDGISSEPSATSVNVTDAVPHWKEQITVRGFVIGTILGGLFAIIIVRMNVGYGIQPPVNIASGLMGYFFLKVWTRMSSQMLERLHFLPSSWSVKPFTKQEVNFM